MNETPAEQESHPILPQTRVPRDESESEPDATRTHSLEKSKGHPIATQTRVP